MLEPEVRKKFSNGSSQRDIWVMSKRCAQQHQSDKNEEFHGKRPMAWYLNVIQLKWLLHMKFQGNLVPWSRILLTSWLILLSITKYSNYNVCVCVCVCVHTCARVWGWGELGLHYWFIFLFSSDNMRCF